MSIPIWLVRAGRTGHQEEVAIDNNLVAIGWEELGDISSVADKESLLSLYNQIYPGEKPRAVSNKANQIWRFAKEIKIGDYVVLPLKTEPVIAIGQVTGEYEFNSTISDEVRHIRRVKWLTTDMPRTRLKQDLLYSLGAFMTVCRIQRNDAETRIPAALDKYLNGSSSVSKDSLPNASEEIVDEVLNEETVDVEGIGRDQIRILIEREFAGHRLQDLVASILRVEGFQPVISPPGKDGGVDILAGKGLLGLEEPRVCVQVKATSSPVGIDVLNSLLGVVASYDATYGLVVSIGGFTKDARRKAKEQFFKVRLWDSDDVIDMLLKVYDKLDEEIQASLPLKRVWITVPSE